MTERELKKISRVDLLEMLLAQSREMEQLRKELEQTKEELKNRNIALEESGNIAEAALRLNDVFEAAQAAADEYIRNVTESSRYTEEWCRKMEEDTRERCRAMVREAKEETDKLWSRVWNKLSGPQME